MKKWKCLFSGIAVGLLAFNCPLQALAETAGEAAGSEAQESQALTDNVLEYTELGALIKNYNPTMKNVYNQMEYSIDDIKSTENEFRELVNDYKTELNDLKEDRKELVREAKQQNTENTPEYKNALMQLDAAIAMYEGAVGSDGKKVKGVIDSVNSIANGYKTAADKLEKPNSYVERQLQDGVDQVTVIAQQLFITYDNLNAQKTMLGKVKDMQAAAYEAAKLSAGQQIGTETDILSAQKELAASEASYLQISSAVDGLYRQICLLTGKPTDSSVVISSVPAADVNRVAAMNLEADTERAVANNRGLIALRKNPSGKTTVGVRSKTMNVGELEQKVRSEMERLYQTVAQKKILYDAAMTSYEKARLSKEAADHQYRLGMVSRIQYLGLDIAFTQAEAARKSADTALTQAMETYDWAVKGILTIED